MNVTIEVPSRIHITLIDLGHFGYRRNGGIGFSIEEPVNLIKFQRSEICDLAELHQLGFSVQEIELLVQRLRVAGDALSLGYSLQVNSVSGPRRHTGMGSGTAVILACLEALLILNSHKVEQRILMLLSGRGGASGIGIHSYFSGGFVLDAGRRFDDRPLQSSEGVVRSFELPSKLIRYEMPRWPIGLLNPSWIPQTSQDVEQKLFDSLPLPQEEVYKTAYHAVFGTTTAIAVSDFQSFCKSINTLQTCAWKQREIDIYESEIISVMAGMRELGCDAVGMSSVGPFMYFFAADFERVINAVRSEFYSEEVKVTMPRNFGRKVRIA